MTPGKRFQKTFPSGTYKGCILYISVGKHGMITRSWQRAGSSKWVSPPKEVDQAIDLYLSRKEYGGMTPVEFVFRIFG